jgi:type I restriction enzyme S subunit
MNSAWKQMKLIDVLQKTETINPQKTPNDSFKYIDVSSICNKRFVIKETSIILGKNAPSRARKLVRTGDILFATVRPTLKRIAQVPKYLDGQVCSTGYFVLRPKDFLEGKFLFYFLFTEHFMGVMEQLQKGASYPAVNDGEVSSQTILIPPLPEQKRIVSILDEAFEEIDRAISNTEKNLSNARELFESYLNSIFSQKGEGWEEKKLGEVCQFENGDRGKNYPNREEYVESGIPWINTGHIQPNGTLSQSEMNFITQEKYESLRSGKIRPGDLVYCLRGATIGKTALVAPFTVGAVASSLVIIRPSNLLDSHFLYYFLTSSVGKRQIKLYDNGAAQPNLGAKSVAKYIIYLPNFAEQKVIVQKLVDLSNETQQLENIYRQKIAALKELKQSILQKAFTGELTADKGITAMEEKAA